jgi:hypothetical protein
VQSGRPKPRYQKLDTALNHLIAEGTGKAADERASAETPPSLRQRGLVEYGEGRIGVTVRFSGPGAAIREFVANRGGHIAYAFEGAIEAYLDPAVLPDLNALPEVARVDAIRRPDPQVISQGVQAHNAVPWQAAGYLGQGVKVGIIDTGFLGWSSLPPADTPSLSGVRCYVGGGSYSSDLSSCEADAAHGTAVAEAVHDVAPGATFYLANPVTNGEIHDAVQWMLQQGVRVINLSIARDWDGPGDGTSPYPDSPLKAVDAAVAGGAVVTVSSGDYGQAAWFGPWQDADRDELLDFTVDVPLTCLTAAAGELVSVELRWQDVWGGASRDVDLWLYDYNAGLIVASSEDAQSGRPADVPHERLDYLATVPSLYCVAVERYSGTAPPWVQLRVASKQSLDIFNPETSVTNPAETANAGALAVGAASWQTPSAIELFSSRGPTPDGRVKPDLVGVDQADSYTYGPNGFAGTSQSSPHVAGLAAIVAQGNAGYAPAQIASTLKNWALARGTVPNNAWGYGLAYLPTVYNLTVSKSGTGAGTVTSLDARVNCGTACVQTYFAGASVTLTASAAMGSVFSGWTGGGCAGTGSCTVTLNAATTVTAIFSAVLTPVLTWPAPAAIIHGTPLGGTQLNATANVPGTFVYTPGAGTVLSVGQHLLSAAFTPTDTLNYQGASASVSITVVEPTPGDFDRDGTSDILWRHVSLGDVWMWETDGAARTAEAYLGTAAEPAWEVAGTGDLTGDGAADILWRHATTGAVYVWTMSGGAVEAETYVDTVDPAYVIVGTGDYDGDGKSDILWRHSTGGGVWLWLMNGADLLSESFVKPADPAYVVQGSGDLDKDGKCDIVWRHATVGDVWVWLMDGATQKSEAWVGTEADPAYAIAAVADLTGDGRADILWRHETRGELWVWEMAGLTQAGPLYLDELADTGYRVAGSGDYDGDGHADLLWHHAARGDVWVWLMNGPIKRSEARIGIVQDTGYQIVK